MRNALIPAAAACFALAACNSDERNTNELSATGQDDAYGTEEPATGNLELNSSAPSVDTAINRTDEQGGLDATATNVSNSVSNSLN